MTTIHRKPKLSFKLARIKSATKKEPLYSLFGSFILDTRSQYFSRHVFLRTLMQVLLIGLSIGLGYMIKLGLLQLEAAFQVVATFPSVIQYIPLFPLAMIGGIIVQITINKLRAGKIVHGKTMAFAGSISLEVVIIAAIATMSLAAISDNIVPFMLLALVGTIWNIIIFLTLAPRIMKPHCFERGIGDFGQSMGMTPTGLLLMKTADSTNKSHALERFGYKQLLFEPIVGGGIFTAVSMIVIAEWGLGTMLILTASVMVFWIGLGLYSFGRR